MNEQQSNHSGRRERLRLRIENEGVMALKQHELLEFLLYYILPRQDVNLLAHDLLDYFGDIDNVLQADRVQLSRVKGVGASVAEWLMLLGEAVKDYERQDTLNRPDLKNYALTFRHAAALQRDIVPPQTWQLCLDMNHRLIYQRCITPSRAWGEAIVLRDALADVFAVHATSVILVQFVGNMHADYGDYDLRRIDDYAFTLHAAGSQLLDMIIIGEGGLISMRQEGRIPSHPASHYVQALREDYLRPMADDSEIQECE